MNEFYGIFSAKGKAWAQAHRERHKQAFAACEALICDCHSALHGKPANGNLQQLLVSLLFARCLEHFQSSVLLLEYGMVPSAKAVLRALCEAMFAACAISRDESVAETYVASILRQHQRRLNKALNSEGKELAVLRVSATPAAMAKLRDQIAASGAREVKSEELAKIGGVHDWYLTVYAMLSDAVHTSVQDLTRYFERGPDGSFVGLLYGSSDREADRLLALGALGMVNARGALGDVYRENTNSFIDKHEAVFRKLVIDWTSAHPDYDEWGLR
jgi:Family of unknown function (DUF5677)